MSFRLKITLNADASPALRVASPALSTWNFQKNGNQCRNFLNAGAPPAVRVGHPHWGLSQISENGSLHRKTSQCGCTHPQCGSATRTGDLAKSQKCKFTKEQGPVRMHSSAVRVGHPHSAFRRSIQKSPSLVRTHWAPVRVDHPHSGSRVRMHHPQCGSTHPQ